MKQCTIDDDDELKLQKSPSCVVFKSKFNLFTILLLAQEQEQVLDSEPPPLLKEVRDGKNLRTIPCLDSLPVLSTYNCIESYFHVYQPLMLFELWTSISKDVDEGSRNEDSRVFFYTIKHETPRILFTTLNFLRAQRGQGNMTYASFRGPIGGPIRRDTRLALSQA